MLKLLLNSINIETATDFFENSQLRTIMMLASDWYNALIISGSLNSSHFFCPNIFFNF